MKRIKLLTCLTLALALIFGNSLTAYASEITDEETAIRDENNIFYDPSTAKGEDGKWHYVYSVYETISDAGSVRYTAEIVSEQPMCMFMGDIYQSKSGYEMQPYYIVNTDTYNYPIRNISLNNIYYSYEYSNAYYTVVDKDGKVNQTERFGTSFNVNMSNGYKGMVATNIPIFANRDIANNYLATMDDSEATNKKPASVYDKELGYLHNLNYEYLVIDDEESGVPKEAIYRFTWDKYYDSYDSTYSVEVWAVCNVETKKFFGLGESELTRSERKHVKTVPYVVERDGQISGIAEITNTEMNALFQSDWDVGGVYVSTAWNYDYYLRIVKDETYGPWTVWSHLYGPLKGSDTSNIYVAEDDENGNIVKDTNTEYGSGITKDPSVGVGGTIEDAEDSLINGSKFDGSDFSSWFQYILEVFKSFLATLGEFPHMLGQVFTFLPEPIILMLCAVLVLCVIFRIVGR